MNKLIEQLVEQAGGSIGTGLEYAVVFGETEDVEKFVELIVKECAQVCADRGKHHDGLYSAWASDCSERIEKHFGVEE